MTAMTNCCIVPVVVAIKCATTSRYSQSGLLNNTSPLPFLLTNVQPFSM